MTTYPATSRCSEGPGWSWQIGPTGVGGRTPLATSIPGELDRITRLAGERLDVPAVCATLVDGGGNIMASCYGLDVPRALLITHALRHHLNGASDLLVVDDATRDPRLADSQVVRDGTVRACVGIGLSGSDGLGVGSLLLMDPQPRRWTVSQLESIRELANAIENGVASAAFAVAAEGPPPGPAAALFERKIFDGSEERNDA
jgi:GAF domain-containing protein